MGRNGRVLKRLGCAILLACAAAAAREIPAFPGAEGFGAMTPGGRGGRVLFVTNLNDAGPGSFREACMAQGPRVVMFRVGGLITLESPLRITEPYLTIAGQTAPGDGICLRSDLFTIATHDVVVRFLRSRLGDLTRKESDSISISTPSRNVILDHCSASWSIDETLSPSGDIANITVQWCLIAESLNHSFHSKGAHGYGSLVHATGGLTLHHNLWAHHTERNPRLGDNGGPPFPTFDVRNNVMYNWGGMCSGLADGDLKVNYVGNYIRPGPSSSKRKPIVLRQTATARTRYCVSGNFVESRPDLTADNEQMFERVEFQGKKLFSLVSAPFPAAPVRTQSAQKAYEAVLENVGATVPVRDAVDARIIADVRNRTGRLIDSQKEVGGWPAYRSGTPPQDSDNDGIPDAWETAHGMNPRDPRDASAVDPGSGYTRLEVYLNELAEGGARRVVIARDGRPSATIVAQDGASRAARELSAYLRKITGASFPVRSPRQNPGGTSIIIGKGAADLGPEGFRIRTHNGNLLLIGADKSGVDFAVYTFLEKYLGVRWFWPGELGEVVPKRRTIELGPIDDVQKPDFLWRDRGPGGALWGAARGPTEMHARARLLGVSEDQQRQVRLWERRNKWGGWKIYGGHSLGEIFPPEKYARAHPEYYALVNGKRDVPGPDYDYKHRGQVCTANPEVVEVAAEWVNRFFDARPDYQAVHITMNDGAGFCECDRCRALDSRRTLQRSGIDAEETKGRAARNTVITDRIFTYVNQVSERVQKRHPGKYVVSMAYGRYILPPEKIPLHPYVIPQYCMWGAYRHANPELKREQESIAAGWAKAARMAGIYEYFINGSWPGLPRLVVPQIAESIRYLKRQGIRLYQAQSGDEFATNGINYYVAGKLLWDASADEREILDDFYTKAFGRAAPGVRRFHARLEKAWADATGDGRDVSCNSLDNTRVTELFTPELLASAAADLKEASAAAESAASRKRVEFYGYGLRYAELTVEAVRAARAVDFRAQPDAAQKKLAMTALEACRRRQRFVEALKSEYALPYFWVRYNEESRAAFLPLARLEALAK